MNRLGLGDTTPEALRVQAEVYRRQSPARKWAQLGEHYRMGRLLHAAGLRLRNPATTTAQIHADWVRMNLGEVSMSMADRPMDQPPDNLRVIREVIAAFDALGIPYAIGGSLASGVHGITRFTADADIAVEPFAGLEDRLVQLLGPDYDVSPEAIRQAIRGRSTFNIINIAVGFKVDVFIRQERGFDRSMMGRRVAAPLADSGPPLAVVSAEDAILLKLEWYRLGGEASDRQWADILGIMRVQGGRLDGPYLDHWAGELGVLDLLDDARRDADL